MRMSHRLIYLDAWSAVGRTVWKELRVMALSLGVGCEVSKVQPFPISYFFLSLPPAQGSDKKTLSFCSGTMPAWLLAS